MALLLRNQKKKKKKKSLSSREKRLKMGKEVVKSHQALELDTQP